MIQLVTNLILFSTSTFSYAIIHLVFQWVLQAKLWDVCLLQFLLR